MKNGLLSFLISKPGNIPSADYNRHWVVDKKHCHDAWLHWIITDRCNLNCLYCGRHDSLNKESGELPKINIPALIRSLDKANKIFKIRFTGGGEPFLVPNIVEACLEITKEHYVGFNTNLTCDNVQELADKIDPEKVANINASVHIKELEKHNLVERFIRNYLFCKRKGINIVVSFVAYPPIVDEVEKYRVFFKEKGIPINFSFFGGFYNGKEYPRSYTEKEIEQFDLNKIWMRRYYEFQGICNAGFNAGIVNPDGSIYPCFSMARETMGNIYDKIEFKKYLVICPVKYCGCQLKNIDPYLFKKALEKNLTMHRKIMPFANYFPKRIRNQLFRLRSLSRKFHCLRPNEVP